MLRHERLIIAGSIALLVALSWWFLARGAGMPASMSAMRPPLIALVTMWWLMMVAMMLPSAAPAVLLYARVRRDRGHAAVAATWVFAAGYLAIWLLFSVAAAMLQVGLSSPATRLQSASLASAFLIAAGAYQLSPLKAACLRQCRSPAAFLSRHWRPGSGGAVRLGLLHGVYCLGCCWLLMTLLFVGGVMNLLWVVTLTAIVAIEKLVPRGDWFGRAAGVAIIGWGAFRLAV